MLSLIININWPEENTLLNKTSLVTRQILHDSIYIRYLE